MRIKINTDQVREVGRQLIADSDKLLESGRRVVSVAEEAEWESESRLELEDDLGAVRSQTQTLGEQLFGLGRKLTVIAERFDQADNEAAAAIRAFYAADALGFDGNPYDSQYRERMDRMLNPDLIMMFNLLVMSDEELLNWLITGRFVTYEDLGRDLFLAGEGDGSAIEYDDVQQGTLGDCYLMAAMSAIAQRDPEYIERMIKDNHDGTYTVTFYELDANGVPVRPVEITVDGLLPTEDGRTPCFGRSSDEGELWPAIIEKAYVEWKGGAGDYEDIEGGYSVNVMAEMTGVPAQVHEAQTMSVDQLRQTVSGAIEGGHPICIGMNGHARVITGIDAQGNLLVYDQANPQGGLVTVSIQDLRQSGGRLYIGET